MHTGESAGFAAAQAHRYRQNVADINTTELCKTLTHAGVKTCCEYFF
jgi:hypothetical protein